MNTPITRRLLLAIALPMTLAFGSTAAALAADHGRPQNNGNRDRDARNTNDRNARDARDDRSRPAAQPARTPAPVIVVPQPAPRPTIQIGGRIDTRIDAARLARERQAQFEAARLAQLRAQVERDRLERDRLERERLERERFVQSRVEYIQWYDVRSPYYADVNFLANMLRFAANPIDRQRSADRLGLVAGLEMIPLLQQAAAADINPAVRLAAGNAILNIQRRFPPPAPQIDRVTRLIYTMRWDNDRDDRADAAEKLGDLRATEAIDDLTQAVLLDSDSDVRKEARKSIIRILGQTPPPTADLIPAYPTQLNLAVRQLLGAPRDNDREAAARWLGQARDEQAIPALVYAAMFDGDDDVRSQARGAALEIRDPRPQYNDRRNPPQLTAMICAPAPTCAAAPATICTTPAPTTVYATPAPVYAAPAPRAAAGISLRIGNATIRLGF
ncbi:MAG: hypothetical protein BIFFINMI_04052 [Phycisphaerae bacterium]|nr:hypothetical protein [Phycisphaerae bacterium]